MREVYYIYASRTENDMEQVRRTRGKKIDRNKLRKLYLSGLPTAEIAQELGMKTSSIRTIASMNNISSAFNRGTGLKFRLSGCQMALLKCEADKRNMRPSELAHQILYHVINDDIIGAVIDDGK